MTTRHSNLPSHEFGPQQYLAAAREHAGQLSRLYDLGYYVLAVFWSGVAVECIFRAYRARIDPSFDSRHDLRELSRAARFNDIVPSGQVPAIGSALGEIAARWSNNHRYRSEQTVRALYRKMGLHQGIRGDFLKENARIAVAAATRIVILGVARWTDS